MAISFATVLTDAKDMIDESQSSFVPDSSWNRWIDQATEELHRLLWVANPDAYTYTADFTIANETTAYTLPTDLRAMRYLVFNPGPAQRLLTQVPSVAQVRGFIRVANTFYVRGSTGAHRLYYIKAPTLTAGTNLDTAMEPWSEFIAIRAAVKAANKDENQRTVLERRIGELRREIETVVARDSATPMSIIETVSNDPLGHWNFGIGGSSLLP